MRLIQLLYRIRREAIAMLRLKTRGVKVMVFNPAGQLLLIRNSYGRRRLFVLPGGGIGWRESPEDAAAREVREETEIIARELQPRSVYVSRAEGRNDTIHLFTATGDGVPKPCQREVEEARFFALDALPDNVSAATLRRVAEYRGERPVSHRW